MGRAWSDHYLRLFGRSCRKENFLPDQVEQIKGRITGVVGTENTASDTDLVIEAVFEDFDIKSAVFNTLNEVCDENTILASNTSSLSVNELALASGDLTDLLDYTSSIIRRTDS